MPNPASIALFLCFAAAVLLLFASISPPAWDRVSFLTARVGGTTTVFGVFGECVRGGSCTRRSVGYNLALNGASNAVNINSSALKNLTYILILHPIGGFLALLAFLFGVIGIAAASRASTIIMAFFGFFAAVVTLVVFVVDMVLWNIIRNRIRDAGYSATLGNANWFTVAAFGALLLSFCTSVCGACGRFATGRAAGEKY